MYAYVSHMHTELHTSLAQSLNSAQVTRNDYLDLRGEPIGHAVRHDEYFARGFGCVSRAIPNSTGRRAARASRRTSRKPNIARPVRSFNLIIFGRYTCVEMRHWVSTLRLNSSKIVYMDFVVIPPSLVYTRNYVYEVLEDSLNTRKFSMFVALTWIVPCAWCYLCTLKRAEAIHLLKQCFKSTRFKSPCCQKIRFVTLPAL